MSKSEGRLSRRNMLTLLGSAMCFPVLNGFHRSPEKGKAMHGLIGKIKAKEGQRDALIDILIKGVSGMPGCLSYIVARDKSDENGIWITEVWESEASHRASLALPQVMEAIKKGRPLIENFESQQQTVPVGGFGI